MLKRRKPLKRSKPLRAKKPFWARSKHPRKGIQEAEGKKPPKPIRKISKSRARHMRKDYYPANNAYLSLPENKFCHVCVTFATGVTRDELLSMFKKAGPLKVEMIWRQFALSGAPLQESTEVHHVFGRTGIRLLCDDRGFCASCRGCREVPHLVDPMRARELGILAKPQHYNSWDALNRLNGLALAA